MSCRRCWWRRQNRPREMGRLGARQAGGMRNVGLRRPSALRQRNGRRCRRVLPAPGGSRRQAAARTSGGSVVGRSRKAGQSAGTTTMVTAEGTAAGRRRQVVLRRLEGRRRACAAGGACTRPTSQRRSRHGVPPPPAQVAGIARRHGTAACSEEASPADACMRGPPEMPGSRRRSGHE